MKLINAIDTVFSHNEIVQIHKPDTEHTCISQWRGMAHQLPKEYHNCEDWRIFGCIPDTIDKADAINILIRS